LLLVIEEKLSKIQLAVLFIIVKDDSRVLFGVSNEDEVLSVLGQVMLRVDLSRVNLVQIQTYLLHQDVSRGSHVLFPPDRELSVPKAQGQQCVLQGQCEEFVDIFLEILP
jgi:hypothetical protein